MSLFYYDALCITGKIVAPPPEYYYAPTNYYLWHNSNAQPGMLDPYSIEGIQKRSAVISKKVLKIK